MEESYLRAMGFRRRRTNRAPLCESGAVAGMWCRAWGACQRVAENAPTVLPLAQRAFRFPPAPLRNRQIAFGCGRIAVRASARRALGCGGVLRHGWHGRAGASARRSLCHRLPVRRKMRASSAHERHPARSEYLPSPPAAPCRRCAHPAARARSGPVPRRASAGALVAHVRFCGARSAHLTLSKVRALALDCAENSLDTNSICLCL